MSVICKSCGYVGIKNFLSLGEMPPVNAFIDIQDIKNEKKYPLNLAYCPFCYLVQLQETVSPDELFRNYLHLSQGSNTNIQHLRGLADYLFKKLSIGKETKILEVGSNDGTLLSFLKDYTSNVLGVDPARNLAVLNMKKGVDYIPEFFDSKTATSVLNTRGKFDLIIALNVVPHTPEVINLLKAIRLVLEDHGTLVMEGVYALETILNGEFDTIYHEHVYTFSLLSLISTFRYAGLRVVDVEKIPTQGGSLRIYAMKEEFAKSTSDAVKNILREEEEKGLSNPSMYESIKRKVEDYRASMRTIVEKEKNSYGKIIGLGAPARGMVLLNYCGIDSRDMQYIVDDTLLKQGKLTPGVHIPVTSFDTLYGEKDRTFLLLSWNYKESFINRLKDIFPSFRVIIPFPKLEVVEYR